MKKFFTILFLIFLTSCLNIDGHKNSVEGNSPKNIIDISKEYSFEEYVNLLSKVNISKSHPDINKVPE
tara:strand:+ start:5 stop:208 length:204 start_codon:yes stop_codon:yes gene_type:complete